MLFQFWGTGSGFEFRVKVNWRVFTAFMKALVVTVLALFGLWAYTIAHLANI